MQRQPLAVAFGYGPPRAAVEQFFGGKVVERQTHRADEAREAAPAARQLDLVARFFLHFPVNVHRAVGGVGLDVRVDFLRVEKLQCAQFLLSAQDVAAAEFLTRNGTQLAQHHVVAGLGVARKRDLIDGGLLTFADAHHNVHRVAHHGHFLGLHVEKQVAVIHVKRSDVLARRVESDAFLQLLHVVNVAFFEFQDGCQLRIGIQVIAFPINVAVMVLFAFLYFQMHAHCLVVVPENGILHEPGIAVALDVVKRNEFFLVLNVFGADEFGRREETVHLALLGLFQFLAQLVVGEGRVSVYFHLIHFHFAPLVHVENQSRGIARNGGVAHLVHLHHGVHEAFVHEILAHRQLGVFHQCVSYDLAFDELDFFGQRVAFALADAPEREPRQPCAFGQVDVEVYFLAFNLGGLYVHIAHQAQRPYLAHRRADVVAGHGYLVADAQARNRNHGVGIQKLHAGYGDCGNFVLFGPVVIHHNIAARRSAARRRRNLRVGGGRKKAKDNQDRNLAHGFLQIVIGSLTG